MDLGMEPALASSGWTGAECVPGTGRQGVAYSCIVSNPVSWDLATVTPLGELPSPGRYAKGWGAVVEGGGSFWSPCDCVSSMSSSREGLLQRRAAGGGAHALLLILAGLSAWHWGPWSGRSPVGAGNGPRRQVCGGGGQSSYLLLGFTCSALLTSPTSSLGPLHRIFWSSFRLSLLKFL